jgi:transposase
MFCEVKQVPALGAPKSQTRGGYDDLYCADRRPAPVGIVLCWSHAWHKSDIAGNVRKCHRQRDITASA